ncbi:MAG: class I SAM-dependent methyltransferase [Anaerolineae bacterium]
MYERSAAIYDAIYRTQRKDYRLEVVKLEALIDRYKVSDGNRLLDVGCGTGGHFAFLRDHFDVQVLDNSEAMLAQAQTKHPDIRFHRADMADFNLGEQFDVITCLFSAIGYTQTLPRLNHTFATFARHLRLGGVVLVEPWFGPGILQDNKVWATFVDEPELKVARMNINRIEGGLSYLDFHYMVGTPQGIEYFQDTQVMGLFTHAEYMQAVKAAGLKAIHDEAGLDGRGLYIGVREA